MTLAEAISVGADILQQNNVPAPRREAALLLSLATGKDRTYLFSYPEEELGDEHSDAFSAFISRRAAREPFQHISGRQEFHELDFVVTPDVLIPRPETEAVVESAVEILSTISNPSFCEIGVGSGCIAVSILHSVRSARGSGFDISESALQIARLNSELHNVSDRLELGVSDIFDGVGEQKFDLIVSNPPYVPADDFPSLQAEVREYEPRIALTDGADGLSVIRRIVADSPRFLVPEGHLLLEIGFGQHERVSALFDGIRWTEFSILPDLQGIPRMVRARLA